MRLAAALAAALLAAPLPSRAAPDPRAIGEIDASYEAKKNEIAKEYGERNEFKMSNAERREKDAKERAALREILSKYGVSEKEYARSRMMLNKEKKAEAAEAAQAWKEKKEAERKEEEKKKAGAAAKAEEKAEEIQVQRGFDDKHPPFGERSGKAGKGKDKDSELGGMVEIPVPPAGEEAEAPK
jgi:hypothetical protein